MQRPIKFRCWDKINDRFGYQFNKYVVAEDGTAYSFVAFDFSGYIVSLSEALEANDYAVQESTGLLDKNGTEIYEGDIVRETGWKNMCIVYQAPEFVEKWATPKSGISKAWSAIIYHLVDNKPIAFCEVIGNIMESPELLKEERIQT